MPKNSKWLLLFSACALAFGQDSKPINVTGTVTNSVTGEPVLRAHVVLRSTMAGPQGSQKKYGSLATAEGKFAIAGLEPGRYAVVVDKVGFVTWTDFPMITLQPGDDKEDLQFKLVPTGAITGRVLNADGDPMDGAMVVVENAPFVFGNNATADEKGQFRIGGLAPGRYRVRAVPQSLTLPPEIRTDGTKEVHYAPTYYPNSLLPKTAARVEARAGSDTSGIEIRLVRTPIVRVSGTVSGLPPEAQNVRIEVRRSRSSTSGATVKPDGKFEIWKLDPGKYLVVATWNGPGNVRMQSSPADVEVSDSNIDGITLNVLPPIDLTGHVEFEDEEARPQQPQAMPPRQGAAQAPPRTVPRRLNFSAIEGYMSAPVELGADDSFHLTGLSPGRYRANPGWGGNAYVKSMRLGPMQVEGSILDLRNGAPGASLTVVMSSATGEVTGSVNDDNGPASGAMVALVTDDWESGPAYRYERTRPGGVYVLTGIAPGRYRIAAVDEADRAQVMRGTGLEDYLDRMETIDVRPNEKITKDLKQRKP